MSKQYCLVQLGRKASKKKQIASLNNYYLVSITKKTRSSKKDNPKKIQLISWTISEYQGGKLVKCDQKYAKVFRYTSLGLSIRAMLKALEMISIDTDKPIIIENHAVGIFKKLTGLKVSKRQEHELDKVDSLLANLVRVMRQYDKVYLVDLRYQAEWSAQGKDLNDFLENKAKMFYQKEPIKKEHYTGTNSRYSSGRPHIINKGVPKHTVVNATNNKKLNLLPMLNFTPSKGNVAYIDGAKRHSSGVGAYGYFAQLEGKAKPISYAKADKGNLTSQRMELRGLLSFLKKYQTEWFDKQFAIVTDSQYVVNVLTKANHLENLNHPGKKTIKNADLLKSVAKYLKQSPKLFVAKAQGHSDNAGNNQIDKLINQAMDQYQN